MDEALGALVDPAVRARMMGHVEETIRHCWSRRHDRGAVGDVARKSIGDHIAFLRWLRRFHRLQAAVARDDQ